MIMKPGIILLAISGAALAACSEPPADKALIEAADPMARGAELLAPFKSDLKKALSTGRRPRRGDRGVQRTRSGHRAITVGRRCENGPQQPQAAQSR
jgi:hypothetical protein